MPYFWARGSSTYQLCSQAPPSLCHLLCDCPGTTAVCERFGVPHSPAFLRVFLLGLSGLQTASLITALEGRLASPQGEPLPVVPARPSPRMVDGSWVIFWDGSFSPGGAGCKLCGYLTCTGHWLHVMPCHLACTTQHSPTEHY